MQYLITLSRFNKFSKIALPVFVTLSLVFCAIGSYVALISSPVDYQQGEYVRIMYVHVPSAWMSLSIYLSISLSAASYLIWKNPLSAIFLKCSIPIGTVFSAICLITGALWGRPVWGVFWAWDARLTAMLILFFIYIGLYILYHAFENDDKAARATSVLALIGLVNLPIIRFSVIWFNTLHQPASVMKLSAPSIAPQLMLPLMLMFAFFIFLFLSLLIIATKAELIRRKNRRIMFQNYIAA